MPRGLKIATATRRAWLDSYEHGQRLDQIAKEAARAERTVKDQIDRARHEREQDQVRAGLLRDAYQQHFTDLMNWAQDLLQRTVESNPQGLWALEDRRASMLRSALRSHLPKSVLWRACDDWAEASRQLEAVSQDIRHRITRRVRDRLQVHLPEVLVDGFRESLWFAVRQVASGHNLSHMGYKIERAAGGASLGWGAYGLASGVQDDRKLQEVKEAHGLLVGELARADSNEVARVGAGIGRFDEARDTTEEEVESLLLRRMPGGQCHLCPGGGGFQPTRFRRISNSR